MLQLMQHHSVVVHNCEMQAPCFWLIVAGGSVVMLMCYDDSFSLLHFDLSLLEFYV